MTEYRYRLHIFYHELAPPKPKSKKTGRPKLVFAKAPDADIGTQRPPVPDHKRKHNAERVFDFTMRSERVGIKLTDYVIAHVNNAVFFSMVESPDGGNLSPIDGALARLVRPGFPGIICTWDRVNQTWVQRLPKWKLKLLADPPKRKGRKRAPSLDETAAFTYT